MAPSSAQISCSLASADARTLATPSASHGPALGPSDDQCASTTTTCLLSKHSYRFTGPFADHWLNGGSGAGRARGLRGRWHRHLRRSHALPGLHPSARAGVAAVSRSAQDGIEARWCGCTMIVAFRPNVADADRADSRVQPSSRARTASGAMAVDDVRPP
jgi:hypothetical protein